MGVEVPLGGQMLKADVLVAGDGLAAGAVLLGGGAWKW